jgi:hypothetical protein
MRFHPDKSDDPADKERFVEISKAGIHLLSLEGPGVSAMLASAGISNVLHVTDVVMCVSCIGCSVVPNADVIEGLRGVVRPGEARHVRSLRRGWSERPGRAIQRPDPDVHELHGCVLAFFVLFLYSVMAPHAYLLLHPAVCCVVLIDRCRRRGQRAVRRGPAAAASWTECDDRFAAVAGGNPSRMCAAGVEHEAGHVPAVPRVGRRLTRGHQDVHALRGLRAAHGDPAGAWLCAAVSNGVLSVRRDR